MRDETDMHGAQRRVPGHVLDSSRPGHVLDSSRPGHVLDSQNEFKVVQLVSSNVK